MSKYLDLNGLDELAALIGEYLAVKVDKVNGKGLSANDFTDALKEKLEAIAEGANKTVVDSTLNASSENPVQNKAVKAAIDKKLDASLKGSAGGVAELGADGKVPAAQLPSFVDDVTEGYYYNGKFYKESAHTTAIAGESDKIYVDITTNKTYRYSGTAFVVISETLALGTTSSTAFRGDWGNAAYQHSLSAHAPTTAATGANMGLMSAADKTKLDDLQPITIEEIDSLFGK